MAVLVLAAILASGHPPPATATPAAAAPADAAPAPGGFTPVTPSRILDTRTGLGAPAAKMGPGRSIDVQVTGTAGVPATGAAAVSLNVTVTEPTALGFLTVYPTGEPRPFASNANFVAGQTVANAVVVKLGAGGKVTIFNSSGLSHLVADVAGWHATRRDIGSPFTPAAGVEPQLPSRGDGAQPRRRPSRVRQRGQHLQLHGRNRHRRRHRRLVRHPRPARGPGGARGLRQRGEDRPDVDLRLRPNQSHNRIEVLRLADGVLEAPILVGSQPMGLDLAPDGKLLYVANRGSSFVSVVGLGTRTEQRRIPIPSGFADDTPYSIAVLANGKALLTTTFYGDGFGSYMLEIDLATDVVMPRSAFFYDGRTTEYTSVRASGDRKSAVVVVGDLSSGPVFRYDTITDAYTEEVNTNTFTSAISTNLDGSVTLVNLGSFVYDEEMRLLGTVPGCGTLGVAVNAAGTAGYGLLWDHHLFRGFIAVCDLVRFQVAKRIPLGAVEQVGRLQLSPDGGTLVGIIDTGLVLLRL